MNSSVQDIRRHLEQKPTAELRNIYLHQHEHRWSDEAVAAMREILIERGAFTADLPVYDLGKIGFESFTDRKATLRTRSCQACGGTTDETQAEWNQSARTGKCPICGSVYTPLTSGTADRVENRECEGVAGWLRFFIVIRMYVDPIYSVILMIVAWGGVSRLANRYPGFALSTLIETGVGIFFLVWGVRIGIALRDIKPRAVQNAKTFLELVLLYTIISPFILGPLSGLPADALVPDSVKEILKTFIFFAIWHRYFNVSRRVKATYPDATAPSIAVAGA